MELFLEYWILFIPLILINIVLIIIALTDLFKQKQVTGNKWVWAAVIILIQYLGPIIYLIFGNKRNE